jgi:hypothetical protein
MHVCIFFSKFVYFSQNLYIFLKIYIFFSKFVYFSQNLYIFLKICIFFSKFTIFSKSQIDFQFPENQTLQRLEVTAQMPRESCNRFLIDCLPDKITKFNTDPEICFVLGERQPLEFMGCFVQQMNLCEFFDY